MFSNKYLKGGSYLSKSRREDISQIFDNIQKIRQNFNEEVSLAGFDRKIINEAYEYNMPLLFKELKSLGLFGLEDRDINAFIYITGGNENEFQSMDDLFKSIDYLIKEYMLETKTVIDENDEESEKGRNFKEGGEGFVNPFRTQRMFRILAQSLAMREMDISENSILGSGGKTYFAYSNPTYLSNKINEWKKDTSELEELASDTINRSSRWIKYLLGYNDKDQFGKEESDFDTSKRLERSRERLDKLEMGLLYIYFFLSNM